MVQAFRRRTSRKGNAEAATLSDGFGSEAAELFGCAAKQFGGRMKNLI